MRPRTHQVTCVPPPSPCQQKNRNNSRTAADIPVVSSDPIRGYSKGGFRSQAQAMRLKTHQVTCVPPPSPCQQKNRNSSRTAADIPVVSSDPVRGYSKGGFRSQAQAMRLKTHQVTCVPPPSPFQQKKGNNSRTAASIDVVSSDPVRGYIKGQG
jgi:hypothetical protein